MERPTIYKNNYYYIDELDQSIINKSILVINLQYNLYRLIQRREQKTKSITYTVYTCAGTT